MHRGRTSLPERRLCSDLTYLNKEAMLGIQGQSAEKKGVIRGGPAIQSSGKKEPSIVLRLLWQHNKDEGLEAGDPGQKGLELDETAA